MNDTIKKHYFKIGILILLVVLSVLFYQTGRYQHIRNGFTLDTWSGEIHSPKFAK